jgi:peroxiredoxin
MKAYQDGIAKLEETDSVVLGISIDSRERIQRFSKALKLAYPLLSDEHLKVSELYGVLNPQTQFANRTTFVVDKQGIIQHIEEGSGAIDPAGAVQMCSMIKKKETEKAPQK